MERSFRTAGAPAGGRTRAPGRAFRRPNRGFSKNAPITAAATTATTSAMPKMRRFALRDERRRRGKPHDGEVPQVRDGHHERIHERRPRMRLKDVEKGRVHAVIHCAARRRARREDPCSRRARRRRSLRSRPCTTGRPTSRSSPANSSSLAATPFGDASQLAAHVAHVRLVHAHEQIPLPRVRTAQPPGALAVAGDAGRFEHAARARVHGVSNLVVVRGRGCDGERFCHPPAFPTRSLMTNSAMGERQMLPWHTNRMRSGALIRRPPSLFRRRRRVRPPARRSRKARARRA